MKYKNINKLIISKYKILIIFIIFLIIENFLLVFLIDNLINLNILEILLMLLVILIIAIGSITIIQNRQISKEKEQNLIKIKEYTRELEEKNQKLEDAENINKLKRDELRQIIDLVPHKIFSKDEDGNFIFVNKATAEGYGLEPKDLEGKNHLSFHLDDPRFPIEEVKQFLADDAKVIKSGETKFIPEEYNHEANGEIKIMKTTKIPFKSTYTDKRAMLGIAIDITREINDMNKIDSQKQEIEASYNQLQAHSDEIEDLNIEINKSYKKINRLAKKFESLIDITSILSSRESENANDFLKNILDAALKIVDQATHGTVYLFKENKVKFIAAAGYDIDILNKLDIKREMYDICDKKILVEEINTEKFVNNLSSDIDQANLKDINSIKQRMIFTIYVKDEKIGGFSLDIADGEESKFNDESIRLGRALQSLTNSFYTMNKYRMMQEEFQQEIALSMIRMLEIHDDYTKGHSENVAELSRKIAKEMGLSNKEINDAYWAGILHDIGKTVIPKEIINKKGKLTSDEYEIIKKHPGWGYTILTDSKQLKEIAMYVHYHHERWDGKGYPEGKIASEIPLISQILSVADTWDSMLSKRSYRNPLPIETAVNELKNHQGTQFSPEIVDIFIKLREQEKI